MGIHKVISLFTYLFPVISALTCCLLMLFTYRDSVRHEERYLRRLAFYYYLSTLIGWFCVIVFVWSPSFFARVNPLCYLSLLISSVIFYHLVFRLTRVDGDERFSGKHYLLPILVPSLFLVWSMFVPFDVRLAIVEGLDREPTGYVWYAYFYVSQLFVAMLFCLVYTLLGICRYYRCWSVWQRESTRESHFPLRWLGILLLLFLFQLCMPLFEPYFVRSNWLDFVPILVLLVQYTLLAYHILVGNYMVLSPRTDNSPLSGENPEPVLRHNLSLDKVEFENYLYTYKPYLDPGLKMADLSRGLRTNRTYLSSFINRTYGMNFSAFINTCRLQELERLLADPSGRGMGIADLITRVGFGSYDSYRRAKKKSAS